MDVARVIAIDGPAASGKSTIARALADHVGFDHISSGSVYRLFALATLRQKVDPSSQEQVEATLRGAEPGFESGAERYSLGEEDVTELLSSQEVSEQTSRIATIPAVRERVREFLHSWCEDRDAVIEGRDIGTVVFPDAELKVFLTASLEERARRRLEEYRRKQLPEAQAADALDQVLQDLARRDQRDASRATAPLKPADDAVQLDSTGKPVDVVVSEIANLLD